MTTTRRFAAWGIPAFAVVLGVLLIRSLDATGGTLVYLLDDPAIHLSMADTLVHHGTWGVVPGEFQSASSSPLWTVLLAGYVVVSPLPDNTGPLVLNVLAAVTVIAVVGRTQRALVPAASPAGIVDGLVVVVLVTVPLFLPTLVLVGMEHTLHVALVVAAVALFARRRSTRWPAWALPAVLAAATAVRLETAFVGAGMIAAVLLDRASPARNRLRTASVVGASVALPIAVLGVWTRASGQGWLPNPVVAKVTGDDGRGRSLVEAAYDRLVADRSVVLVAVVALVALVVPDPRRARTTGRQLATVVLVATVLHVVLARVGWYDRYQGYLLGAGVMLVLELARPALAGASAGRRAALGVAIAAAALVVGQSKLDLTRAVPAAAADTYEQRYQAGVFLDRFYDGEPIATGELGYVSLLHDGPLTDVFGLGDGEVLDAWLAAGDRPSPAYWSALAKERGFRVVAVYPRTLYFDTPETWILVGTWWLDRPPVSAFENQFQFWATDPTEVEPLRRHLQAFETDLPGGVRLELNPFACFRARSLAGGSAANIAGCERAAGAVGVGSGEGGEDG